jgi:hypothetical protein
MLLAFGSLLILICAGTRRGDKSNFLLRRYKPHAWSLQWIL